MPAPPATFDNVLREAVISRIESAPRVSRT